MTVQLDHLILAVNDLDASLAFYRDVFGFDAEGEDGPFTVVRVTPDFVLLLAPCVPRRSILGTLKVAIGT